MRILAKIIRSQPIISPFVEKGFVVFQIMQAVMPEIFHAGVLSDKQYTIYGPHGSNPEVLQKHISLCSSVIYKVAA